MIILGTNSIKDTGGYNVANSCRFNSGDSPYMHRTISASNMDRWTFSAWVKRGSTSTAVALIGSSPTANNNFETIGITSGGDIDWEHYEYTSSSYKGRLKTNRVLLDPSAWYHIVCVWDSANATAGNRMRLYINGVEETSFQTDTNPSSGQDSLINSGNPLQVGASGGASQFFDGYMAEVVLLDGTAGSPTDFGEFDEDSPTIWKPKDVSGLTFGTSGFYLDFEDSGDLGDDESGNGNDFTEVNLDAADQTPDTCTNNFATLNPLGFAGTTPTFSQGNLNALCGSGVSLYSVPTIGVSSGKWYVEGELEQASITGGAYYVDYGFHDRANTRGQSYYVSNGRMFWLSSWDGKINYRTGGSTTAGLVTGLATLTPGDFFQLYLDMDNELMYWGKNGSLLNSTGVSFNGKESLTGEYFFAFGDQFTSGTHEYAVNFGQGSIDGSAVANFQDANGFGNFKYNPTVTTDEGSKDFLALCTKNLGSDGG
jgi:hypothetical protein